MTSSKPRVSNAFARAFDRLIHPLVERWLRTKAYGELMSMDDRMLADMGISRADIDGIAAGLYAETNALSSPRLIADRVNRVHPPEPAIAHNDRTGSRVA